MKLYSKKNKYIIKRFSAVLTASALMLTTVGCGENDSDVEDQQQLEENQPNANNEESLINDENGEVESKENIEEEGGLNEKESGNSEDTTSEEPKEIVYNAEDIDDIRRELNTILNYDFSKYKVLDENTEKYTTTFNALDTIVQLIIYSDKPEAEINQIFEETRELIEIYENLISKTIEGSFTDQLNTTGEFYYGDFVYEDVIHQLVDKSTEYEKLSNGAFDVTMEPVVSLWNINNGNTEVPAKEDINAALDLVDYNNLVRDEEAQKYVLLNGSTVDFGAIAKGHMADIIKGSLMSKGVDSALVNLGGNVMTIGAKPGDKNWVIAIQDPEGQTGASIGTLKIKNKTVVTSGNYERFFIKDGVRYHHILDPETGYPGDSGLIQSTIISDYSIDSDALSTTTFLLGAEEGLELIESLDGFESMFITEDTEYFYSENFETAYDVKITK